MRDLTTGQRTPIEKLAFTVNIDGPRIQQFGDRLGAAVVGLNSARQAPANFQPASAATRELRSGIEWKDNGAVGLDLAAVPADVERIMLLLYIIGGAGSGISFLDFGQLTARTDEWRYQLDLTNRGEAAIVMLEFYRHSGAWRLAANGQGFVGGIRAAASALGVTINVPEPSFAQDAPPPFDYEGGGPGRGRSSGPSSGSGFAIDRRHILTNAHVAHGAQKIRVAGDRSTIPAECVFADENNDIALLRVESDLEAIARFRTGYDLHLGEDIIVLGFPLQGLLGTGPQVTAGNVSSLCGIANDTSVLQFTAPIASGNSGGPILDHSGLIIGMVTSSLNIDRVRSGGGSAENINFGVKAAIISNFLSVAGMEIPHAPAGAGGSRADIVRQSRTYLYKILCDG